MTNITSALKAAAVQKPTIKRTTKKYQGYKVVETRLFHKVCAGHSVRYYPKKGDSPFWNLYRIVSITGTPDYVIHSCK